MLSIRKAATILMIAATCIQLSAPVLAQTTVLTGKVSKSGTRPSLIGQQASLDGRTIVVTPASGAQPLQSGVRTVVIEKPVVRNVYVRDNRTFFQRHPRVKAATIGAGVGTAAGAVTGLVSGRGVLRGAAIGAGTGAGVGLIHTSPTMKRHPIVRDVAEGSLVGLGVGAAASRKGKRMLQGAGVGAAVGLGVGLLKEGLK